MAHDRRRASRVVVFGPHPLLTVTIEARRDRGFDDVHVHPGGQGVWVARMAAECGAVPVLCGFLGGEIGAVLGPLLDGLPGERRLVATADGSGVLVTDRRGGKRQVMALREGQLASRHEVDDLFSVTCAMALAGGVLVLCNPYPGHALPPEVYANLVTDVRHNGTPVLVDLSTPRLDATLEGQPDLVKLNDWELAEYVGGPVTEPPDRAAAVDRLLAAGAQSVVVTRAELPAYAVAPDGTAYEIAPPRFERGFREGCGDSMTGAIAAGWVNGASWLNSVRLGVAAGAANFLRRGLGTGRWPVVDELLPQVQVRPVGRHTPSPL